MLKKPTNGLSSAEAQRSATVFDALRGLLQPYEGKLSIVHDESGHFYANCARADITGKPVFFGAVKASGKKTLFHFMPVYDFPELLLAISPELEKRMQGKSCFNFTAVHPDLFRELGQVVQRGVEKYQSAGKL